MVIEKKCALQIQQHALKAISELTAALNLTTNGCSQEKGLQIKRGVGLSIGTIQTELLDLLYLDYPEIDDLK